MSRDDHNPPTNQPNLPSVLFRRGFLISCEIFSRKQLKRFSPGDGPGAPSKVLVLNQRLLVVVIKFCLSQLGHVVPVFPFPKTLVNLRNQWNRQIEKCRRENFPWPAKKKMVAAVPNKNYRLVSSQNKFSLLLQYICCYCLRVNSKRSFLSAL